MLTAASPRTHEKTDCLQAVRFVVYVQVKYDINLQAAEIPDLPASL